MVSSRSFLFISIVFLLQISCTLNNRKVEETHRKGKAVIYVDESFKPLFQTSIEVFQSQYPKSSIDAVYSSENDIINSFLDNKIKTICISRDLTKKEKANIYGGSNTQSAVYNSTSNSYIFYISDYIQAQLFDKKTIQQQK